MSSDKRVALEKYYAECLDRLYTRYTSKEGKEAMLQEIHSVERELGLPLTEYNKDDGS
jgi:hypothetical protein